MDQRQDSSADKALGRLASARVSRRRVILGLGGTAVASALLAACGGGAPAAPPAAPTAASSAPPTTVAQPALPAVNVTPTTAAAPAAAAPTVAPTTAPAAQATPTTAAAAATTGGKTFVGAWPYELPPTGHFNTLIPHNIGLGIYHDLWHMPLGKYYWATNKYMPLLASEWGFQPPDKFGVKLRKDVKWSDGTPFTAKDLKATLWVQRVMRNVLWNYVDAIDMADDYTLTVHMKTPSTVVERYMLEMNTLPTADYGTFGDRAEKLFTAGKDQNSDEGKALAKDIQEFRPKAP